MEESKAKTTESRDTREETEFWFEVLDKLNDGGGVGCLSVEEAAKKFGVKMKPKGSQSLSGLFQKKWDHVSAYDMVDRVFGKSAKGKRAPLADDIASSPQGSRASFNGARTSPGVLLQQNAERVLRSGQQSAGELSLGEISTREISGSGSRTPNRR